MTRRLSRRILAVLLLLALGCADGLQRAPVRGVVLVDGKPLERGVINFLPVQGTTGPGAGGEIRNGKYALDARKGPVIGTNRVEIRGFRKTGKQKTVMGSAVEEEIQAVPPEFNDQSTLVREIKAGSNTLDFDLPGLKEPP
jgi:hypothetical protein